MSGRMGVGSTGARPLLRGSLVALAAVALLAGCTSNPVQPVSSDSPAPSASVDTTAPSSSPTPSAAPVGVPVDKTCDEFISPDAVYAFNPNFGTDPDYAPASGSAAAEMVDLQGVSCGLLNQTSGEKIEIAVARLTPDALEARKNALVSDSQQVPTFSAATDEGYFSMKGDAGRADAFVGDFWIMTDSPVYFEPGDAQPIVEAVADALR